LQGSFRSGKRGGGDSRTPKKGSVALVSNGEISNRWETRRKKRNREMDLGKNRDEVVQTRS